MDNLFWISKIVFSDIPKNTLGYPEKNDYFGYQKKMFADI